MTQDWLIAFTALILGVRSKSSTILAVWFVANILLIAVIDIQSKYLWWQSMALWAALFSIKDFIFIAILSTMRAPLMLIVAIFASCIFHQVLRLQIMTYNYSNLSLLDYRPVFMMLLSIAMLATVITDQIQGGSSGGKRVKHHMPSLNHCYYCFLNKTTRKVGQWQI